MRQGFKPLPDWGSDLKLTAGLTLKISGLMAIGFILAPPVQILPRFAAVDGLPVLCRSPC
jgi:hypothetical protein